MWLKEFEEKEGRPAGNEEKVRLAQRGEVEKFYRAIVGTTVLVGVPASTQHRVVSAWVLCACLRPSVFVWLSEVLGSGGISAFGCTAVRCEKPSASFLGAKNCPSGRCCVERSNSMCVLKM